MKSYTVFFGFIVSFLSITATIQCMVDTLISSFNFDRDANQIRALFTESPRQFWFLGKNKIPFFLEEKSFPADTAVLHTKNYDFIGFITYSKIQPYKYISYIGITRRYAEAPFYKLLITHAINNLTPEGCTAIDILARPEDRQAIETYISMGFTPTRQTSEDIFLTWNAPVDSQAAAPVKAVIKDFDFDKDRQEIRAILEASPQMLWFLGKNHFPLFLQEAGIPSCTKVVRTHKGYIEYIGIAKDFRKNGYGRQFEAPEPIAMQKQEPMSPATAAAATLLTELIHSQATALASADTVAQFANILGFQGQRQTHEPSHQCEQRGQTIEGYENIMEHIFIHHQSKS